MTPQPGFVPHISELGHGPRRILALHCTLAFGGVWGGVARALDDQVTLLAPDMPSHGRSPDWDETSSFADTVYTAALSAMDDGPMDIIGHSFGAATALRIAAAHPARVRSLMLFEPVFFAVALADDPTSLAQQDEKMLPFYAAMKTGDNTTGARAFNRMWSGPGGWEKLPARAQAAMIRAIHVVPDTHAFLYKDTAGILAPGVLDAVKVPVLLMRGEHALAGVKTTNTGLARRLGNGSEAVLQGAGHMGPVSHPEAVAAHIAALLARS